jgi:hypothetical protein
MGSGWTGVKDRGGIRWSVLDWPLGSNDRADAVPMVDCSSNMLTSLRVIISMGIDEMPAMLISKPYMDTAMTRKPGITVHTSR